MPRILLVEDEEHLRKLVEKWLKSEMHSVESCSDGSQAVEILRREQFDVIVLDIMLPELDGMEVCRRFRASGGTTPILLLTAKRTLQSKEQGLDSGADDYVTKPFKLRELSARIRALARRQPAMVPTVLQVGDLTLDATTNRVFRGQREVKLVPKEFILLSVLMKNAGNLVRSESLITTVWGINSDVSPETIRSYIRLLRQKIDKPGSGSLIETVHGVGYRLLTDVQ